MSYYTIMSKKAIEKLNELKDYFDPTKADREISIEKANNHLDYVIDFLNDIIEDEYVRED